jgi:hypothetical protein
MSLHMKMRACRRPVELEGVIERDEGATWIALVTDLSLDGCGVEAALRIGEFVFISIPQVGRLRAQVRWCLMGKSGLRFARGGAA